MGATNIEFELTGKADAPAIKEAFERVKDFNRAENGSQEGYSGDFQTVERVECVLDRVFDSYDSAEAYCLDHARKWEFVLAVHYKNNKNEINTLVCGWGAC